MKNIIVTGGLGFIGSNLIELLISKNYRVINIDKVTYSSNEEMGKGAITFTRTGGSEDPKSPQTVELNGAQLKQGPHYDESFSDLFLLS